MACETVTQKEAQDAIASLSNVQGIISCARKVLDENLVGSLLWEVSESLPPAINILSDAYCTLNNLDIPIQEAQS